MEQQEDVEQPSPALRSIHNRHSSYVTFINTTRHNVGVYWIDYQGKKVCYRILGCRDRVEINTFVTHPWIFVEEETKDRFPGNGEEVFFPEPWFANYREMRELPARLQRIPVYITLPLYSLRDLCLREIKRRLRFDRQAFGLEIPCSLQRELFALQPRKPEYRGPALHLSRSPAPGP